MPCASVVEAVEWSVSSLITNMLTSLTRLIDGVHFLVLDPLIFPESFPPKQLYPRPEKLLWRFWLAWIATAFQRNVNFTEKFPVWCIFIIEIRLTLQRKMEKSSTGIFSVCLKLYPGKYEVRSFFMNLIMTWEYFYYWRNFDSSFSWQFTQIKFIVDGIWKTDPLRPIVRNGGNENNLLSITWQRQDKYATRALRGVTLMILEAKNDDMVVSFSFFQALKWMCGGWCFSVLIL